MKQYFILHFILVKVYISLGFLSLAASCGAQNVEDTTSRGWLHFQQTIITQYKPPFSAKYSGQNSFRTNEETQTSLTSTFFFGARLWRNGLIYINPEIAGGAGLSRTLGVAGFPNGETYRVGDNNAPTLNLSRAYIHIWGGLTDSSRLERQGVYNYWALNVGKFSLSDFFDSNSYSHDPRSQFMNWSLMANGAWDYPADVKGYTFGVCGEYVKQNFGIRYAAALVPVAANGAQFDTNLGKALGHVVEYQRNFGVNNRTILRFGAYYNLARMGNYKEALLGSLTSPQPDVTASRLYSRSKYGFMGSIEHRLDSNWGMFGRVGWSDGLNETWAFTEIDRSISLGFVAKSLKWMGSGDEFGLALVVNGLSYDHSSYLKAGGYGFIIGDGDLNYAPESILELYYKLRVWRDNFWLSPDFQIVLNPGYNSDRGGVPVLGLRAHVEF
jgi:high affinity Mn2+ porin